MPKHEPPFAITSRVVNSVAAISEMIGRWTAATGGTLSPQLRRTNRIKTVQASLAIENNTLSIEQVTAVLAGKRVLGLPREIQEVRNAFATYEKLDTWSASSVDDLLAAHGMLMAGLVDMPGKFRSGGVGIYQGEKLVHMAPPAKRVPGQVQDLFEWLKMTDAHPLVVSCVVHYELEFIHPFADGNGRIGRLWQTLILSEWQPVMAYLPVESIVRDQQVKYYRVLADADSAGEATPLIEFMLGAIEAAVVEFSPPGSEKSSEKSSEKILAYLRAKPTISARELAMEMDMSPRAVEKQLAALKRDGRVRRVGPAKGGVWEVVE